MTTPRAYTEEEIRAQFLSHVRGLVDYWSSSEIQRDTTKERLEGLAHSIFATIDGCAIQLPGFILAPTPHEDDQAFHQSHGENWYPHPNREGICDIAGSLHDEFYRGTIGNLIPASPSSQATREYMKLFLTG